MGRVRVQPQMENKLGGGERRSAKVVGGRCVRYQCSGGAVGAR